jgi:hypothetical protein
MQHHEEILDHLTHPTHAATALGTLAGSRVDRRAGLRGHAPCGPALRIAVVLAGRLRNSRRPLSRCPPAGLTVNRARASAQLDWPGVVLSPMLRQTH